MKKYKVVQWAFRIGQRRMLYGAFCQLYVQAVQPTSPVLIVVNHSCFYDSLVLFELERRGLLPHKTVAVMRADGLRRFRIFQGLGVVPVSEPVKLSEYKRMHELMATSNVLLFPQGREEHQEKRPLVLARGAAGLLAKQSGHGVLFVSLYYSFGASRRGSVACRMLYVPPDARPTELGALERFLQRVMTEQLDDVKGDVVNGRLDHYERLCL